MADFDLSLARYCAERSQQAYAPTSTYGSRLYANGDAEMHVWHRTGDATVTVAFRGTESLADALTDVRCGKVRTPAGWVHAGAWEYYRRLAPMLADAIGEAFALGASRILFTGHSLGGMLAEIATAFHAPVDVQACYTFGAFRPGNGTFAALYGLFHGDHTWRVVHDADWVPREPPAWLGYHHVGQCALLTADDQLVLNPSWWRRARAFVLDLPGQRTHEHLIAEYIAALDAVARNFRDQMHSHAEETGALP